MRLVEIRDGWIVDVDSISEVMFKPSFVSYTDSVQNYYVEIVVGRRGHEIPFDSEEEARVFYDRFLKDFCKEKWV